MTEISAHLVDWMGDDLRVVNAARVSFDKSSEWELNFSGPYPEKVLSEKDKKLIHYLAEHNHWTPFSHCTVTLLEKVPIFVARQRFKHVVGFTYNEVSRRYVDNPPEFYVPRDWRGRPTNGAKQGSSEEVLFGEETFGITAHHEYCLHYYNELLEEGVAPEQARMVLPQSMMTEYYVTGSLPAWARAYKLRTDPSAQMEIQDLANLWPSQIAHLFPVSWDALTASTGVPTN